MRRLGFVVVAVAAAAAIGVSAQVPRTGASCDPRCLLQVTFEYTEALTDNNVARLAVADGSRHEQRRRAELGKGQVWGPGRRLSYRQTFVDPVTGAAVFYGVVTNVIRSARARRAQRRRRRAGPLVVLRRAAEGRAAAHHRDRRSVVRAAAGRVRREPATLTLPDRIFDTWLPQSERVSRDELFDIANKYFDAVSHRIDYHDVPWHPECQRIELGVFTVNSERRRAAAEASFRFRR